MTRPLDGLRILDLGQLIAGPLCASLLSDLGADVLKIESPTGDLSREMLGSHGASAMFLATNRGKQSIRLNLKSEEGCKALRKEVERADVLIQGFRPGVMERLGLGYETLAAWNPRLIHASISGFHEDSVDAGRPGVDAVLQAETGIMAVTGSPDGPPQKVGLQIVDTGAALVLTQAILAALILREQTGQAQRVSTSLQQASTFMQAIAFTEASIVGTDLPRNGNSAGATGYPTDLFECKDGHWIQIAAYLPDQWNALCDVLETQHLATDPRFITNRERVQHVSELRPLLAERFQTNTLAHWHRLLQARMVLAAPVLGHGDILKGPNGLDGILFSAPKQWNGVEYRDVLPPFQMDGLEWDQTATAPR
ncbi:CaiB/BaiF CoA transferase family protein [Rhodococcus erythropolis]